MAIRGYTMDRQDYLTRLRKIEGQVRGLQRMIEDDAYCIDVMDAADSPDGDAEVKLAEATRAIERLVRLS